MAFQKTVVWMKSGCLANICFIYGRWATQVGPKPQTLKPSKSSTCFASFLDVAAGFGEGLGPAGVGGFTGLGFGIWAV